MEHALTACTDQRHDLFITGTAFGGYLTGPTSSSFAGYLTAGPGVGAAHSTAPPPEDADDGEQRKKSKHADLL